MVRFNVFSGALEPGFEREGYGARCYSCSTGRRHCGRRAPGGERALRRGDLVCFPSGPEGAHAVRGAGRIVIFSTGQRPSISVYPDSDKVGVRAAGDEEPLNFRRGDAVEYWEGE